jgi:hypothetical protein
MQGRFAEATAPTRRALGLLPPRHPLRSYLTQLLQHCEGLRKLDARLPAFLKGEGQPADTAEWLALAHLCQRYKQLYTAAARFYTGAFSTDTQLADNLQKQFRYNAACAAALAAAGRGEDAAALSPKKRARLRRQALDWLRDDLVAWTKVVEQGPSKDRAVVKQILLHWQQDPDLAGVRDEEELVWLVAEERRACRQLWVDVEELIKRSQVKRQPPK